MICWGSQAREEQELATVWALALIAVLSLVAFVVAGRTALVGPDTVLSRPPTLLRWPVQWPPVTERIRARLQPPSRRATTGG